MGMIPLVARVRRWCRVLVAMVASAAAGAQGSGPALSDYNHAVWTANDGAPVHVTRMAQTPDGWLWLGTPNGLYRFDGARFHPFVGTDGRRLLSPRIWKLVAQPDGDLYIGYEGAGLSVLHADGRLEHLAPATTDSPVKGTNDVVRDSDGVLWARTAGGVRRLEQGRWSTLGADQGCPDDPTTVALDGGGQLWAVTSRHLFRYERATRRCVPAPLPAVFSEAPEKLTGFRMSPDDYLRMSGEQDAGPGQHFTLRCEGQPRALHPLVDQELCAIGREALRNAFHHANALRHETVVEYGALALVLTVRDDGRGIDAGAWEKPGHWGLRSIEERARLIHAEARLHMAPGAGTTWRIEIKAALAYADAGTRLRWPWRRRSG